MNILVIAEKPMLRKAIAAALPGTRSGSDPVIIKNGADTYTVTNVYGHVLTMKEPEDYDPTYKKWSLDRLPIYFDNWGQKPNPSASDKVKELGTLLKNADCVIHAGDPDDEGQFLIDEVLRWHKYKGPVKRLDTANTTLEGMKKALKRMNDNKNHEADGYAAYARAVADLVVGVNMSRFFTLKSGGTLLTVGRVQTPTLGLVVARDEAIEGHVKVHYYVITGNMSINGKTVPFSLKMASDDPRLDDGKLLEKTIAEELQKKIANKNYTGISITKKEETEQPPLPFNLVKLQTYCGTKFNYDPKKVMDITQGLRDKYSAITYNRSDCQYLSSDHFAEAPSTVATVCANINFKPAGLDTTIKSKAFNDSLITAHFAIIPTDSKQDISKFTKEEKDVYLAICKYYLAQFMPPAKKLKTIMTKTVEDGKLTSTSTVILSPGYRSIFAEAKPEEKSDLSDLSAGTYDGTSDDCKIEEKETKPPARYTKTSLNEDMTRISKYVKDPEIKKLLLEKDEGKEGENGSIGTTATRSDIIDRLVSRGYLELQGKKLISTKLGREFYNLLPDELKKADMTAKWWVIQEKIKTGECKHSALPESVLETCKEVMAREYQNISAEASRPGGREALGKCPRCGSPIIEGKAGYGCSGYKSGCKFVIWKKAKGGIFQKVEITPAMAKKLLDGKKVHSKKLYSPNKDKLFEADFQLDDKGSPYGAEFKLMFAPFKPKK